MKYYQIREFETAHPDSHDGVVSESELMRRLNIICDEMHSPNKSIEILLHGEKKEREHE